MFLPNHFASTRGALLAATLIGSLAPAVFAQEEGCKPTLDIEITMPTGSQVTEKFGETDHHLGKLPRRRCAAIMSPKAHNP
eukprot:scaffold8882_cov86-Cylindrotheca_fusiformis.AAC.2